ncbi:hypothetical protein PUN28_014871 [Cardiocondyla obscurior]|uniref:Uncharacterized protein n=1 Tax=Cardiocondyla obscurior TaxID=286306 RepID=A0AAW2EZM2_9HYME
MSARKKESINHLVLPSFKYYVTEWITQRHKVHLERYTGQIGGTGLTEQDQQVVHVARSTYAHAYTCAFGSLDSLGGSIRERIRSAHFLITCSESANSQTYQKLRRANDRRHRELVDGTHIGVSPREPRNEEITLQRCNWRESANRCILPNR